MNLEKEKPPLLGETNEGHNSNNIFNIRRALEDVKSFPDILKIYCNPFLTEGCSTHREYFLNFNNFLLNDFEIITIDKIALLFDFFRLNTDSSFVKKSLDYFDHVIDLGNPQIMNSNSLYKYSTRGWCFDYHIQWGNLQNNYPTCRIEFNPNKADLEKLAVLFSAFKKISFETLRLGRIDIAIDYGMYLNPLCWYSKNTIKDRMYRDNGEIKTFYFGSNKSNVQLRVYDKAYELKNEQGFCINNDYWRVEAQVNDYKEGKPYLKNIEMITEFNVFERLEFFDSYGFKPDRKTLYNQFVYNARAYGIEAAKSLLPRNTKYRFLKYLKDDMKSVSFNLPSEIYKHCFKSVYQVFYNKLSELFEAGQKLRLKALEA